MIANSTTIQFAEALRAGISARGLSLERIQNHLRLRGLSVSLATLSYWQSGRSQPERRESMAAVTALEEILRLTTGSLSTLLPAPRSRGRLIRRAVPRFDLSWPSPAPIQAALARIDTSWDDQLTRISLHDRVRIGRLRGERCIATRQILRAERDGVDRAIVIYGLDGATGALPGLRVRRPSRVGRVVTDPHAGLAVNEVLFGRQLARGETIIIEHMVTHPHPGPPASHYERRFRYPVREYVLEIAFHPDAPPARCTQYMIADGPARLRSLTLDPGHSVHHVALNVTPGRCGIRFQWM